MREIHLEDPSFEPSDEELVGLSERAFAHVREQQQESLAKLRAEVSVLRQAALERLRARKAGGRSP